MGRLRSGEPAADRRAASDRLPHREPRRTRAGRCRSPTWSDPGRYAGRGRPDRGSARRRRARRARRRAARGRAPPRVVPADRHPDGASVDGQQVITAGRRGWSRAAARPADRGSPPRRSRWAGRSGSASSSWACSRVRTRVDGDPDGLAGQGREGDGHVDHRARGPALSAIGGSAHRGRCAVRPTRSPRSGPSAGRRPRSAGRGGRR